MKIVICDICTLPLNDCICDQLCNNCGLMIGSHIDGECIVLDKEDYDALDEGDLWRPVLGDD